MKIAILSNVNLDFIVKELEKYYNVYPVSGYGQWVQEAISPSEALSSFCPETVFLLLDGLALTENAGNFENQQKALFEYMGYARSLEKHFPSAKVFISNLDFRSAKYLPRDCPHPERTLSHLWEEELYRLLRTGNAHIFDLSTLISNMGRKTFYSDKMWYMGSLPYSMKGIAAVSDEMRFLLAPKVRKKLLVVDADNTLWGGVIGEDGLDGIVLGSNHIGAIYRDAQKKIGDIHATGVLLALVSKNNAQDVLDVLAHHSGMVLKKEDFVAICADWNEKSDTILQLTKRLNIGLDSVVFLDDNPVERELVRIHLPEVAVTDFPNDIANLPRAILRMAEEHFFTFRMTNEDAGKTEQYRSNVKREELKNEFTSLEEYLKSLEMHVILNKMDDSQMQRVAQLSQKTNQFNLSTRRFDMEALQAYMQNAQNAVFTGRVCDKFGDNGLVFVAMFSLKGHAAHIDNLLMSCRVMGRKIEFAIMAELEAVLQNCGVTNITAEYRKTEKNQPVEQLMEILGYDLLQATDGTKTYRKNIMDTTLDKSELMCVVWERA